VKRYVIIYTAILILILIGFLFSNNNSETTHPYVNTVAVNEIVRVVTLHWDDFDELSVETHWYRFFILDNGGQRLHSTCTNLPDSLISAVRQGFLPMNIMINEHLAGIVVIETSGSTTTGGQNRAVIITFILLCLLNIAFFAVLYFVLIRPFKRIDNFAHKIAMGVLDESLPIYKNNLFGLFTQSFDIMRASLLEARQKQHSAELAQKELVASLSHDIKTPVTSIKLITELLQAKVNDPIILEKLQTIESKTNQISHLMNDMLQSTLDDLGELSVIPSSEDSSILLDIFKNVDHLSKVKLGKLPSCLVDVDVVRMDQVIGNIVSNAYKYANTAINVDFTIEGSGLQVDISDLGRGVDPDALELLTTKFYRGENAKAMQKEGEGLGLYLCKRLMEKMGGGLEVFNGERIGLTVRIWIKLSDRV